MPQHTHSLGSVRGSAVSSPLYTLYTFFALLANFFCSNILLFEMIGVTLNG